MFVGRPEKSVDNLFIAGHPALQFNDAADVPVIVVPRPISRTRLAVLERERRVKYSFWQTLLT
jgi:hypothetical protein